jgi:lipoyl(octanoyl) transferase
MIIKDLGTEDYSTCWQRMLDFTLSRDKATPDEIWMVEHPPVFTLGEAASTADLLQNSDIPVVRTDRGGQVTYHGPGQLVVYFMVNLKQQRLTVTDFLACVNRVLLHYVRGKNINAEMNEDAPGIYVSSNILDASLDPVVKPRDDMRPGDGACANSVIPRLDRGIQEKCAPHPSSAKICSVGFRIKNGCTYHGIALNVAMDLTPFTFINPCGISAQVMTQLADFVPSITINQVKKELSTLIETTWL